MGKEAIWSRDDGTEVPFDEASRDLWVSAGRGRNWLNDDPLLDWLDRFGEAHGFVRDTDLPDYDPDCAYTEFIFAKGHAFENAVMDWMRGWLEIVQIGEGRDDSHDAAKALETYDALARGAEVVYQGVLHDAENHVYGLPDLLIRSDVLHRLVREAPPSEELRSTPAPDLPGSRWHYVVVDIKFKSFALGAKGELGSMYRTNKAQVALYSRALGRLQGYQPRYAFLLGRAVNLYKEEPKCCRFDQRLAPVEVVGSLADADAGCEWVRRVRREGEGWRVLPEPSVDELRPDMGNAQDWPWHGAKRAVGAELEDTTLLWQVSAKRRPEGLRAGVTRWTDPRCSGALFGLSEGRAATLDRILEVHRAQGCQPVLPASIGVERSVWGESRGLEFYVDFETVTDLDDDFSALPEKGGQPLIFMVGCGHEEHGEWKFECFTADQMDEPSEARVLDAWTEHMAAVRRRLAPDLEAPLVFHWSHAERSFLETAYNSASKRHGRPWPELAWFDFLVRVMWEEPVVVRGAMAFGLKAVAKAMFAHGFISTEWKEGPVDGLAAMVGAWRCARLAREQGVRMIDLPLMRLIRDYNEVDCKVMWEIVRHLRQCH